MQVNRVQNNPSFGINVSAHFSKTVQNFYNYGNVPNKRNLIWKFNQKFEQYSKYLSFYQLISQYFCAFFWFMKNI